ncbi:hypothetical protein [Roseovarius sp. D0-M9]|uniref:hypothetical protein n=1 Tax=Roseovarius sp. D0-M9 TaxID=3127117 RepID=UPI00300FEFA5
MSNLKTANPERLRALGLFRLLGERPMPAPGVETMAGAPIPIDARLTMPDGTTLTRIFAISPRTAACDIRSQVRAAMNLDPDMQRARIDRITIRPPRNG